MGLFQTTAGGPAIFNTKLPAPLLKAGWRNILLCLMGSASLGSGYLVSGCLYKCSGELQSMAEMRAPDKA